MTREASKALLMLLVMCLAVCGLAGSLGATPYVFRDLGRVGGLTDETTNPEAVNSDGQVAGTAHSAWTPTTPIVYRAFFWTPQQGIQVLPTLGGTINSWAHAINSAGQIVGEAEISEGLVHAMLWNPGQSGYSVQDLGVLTGKTQSLAYGINDAGVVVGDSRTNYYEDSRACSWNLAAPGSPPQDLGTLGGDKSSARGINQSGGIAGYANLTNGGPDHACLFQSPQNRDLGVPAGGTYSRAYAINAAGNVVGTADYPTAQQNLGHAFYWDHQTEAMEDLTPNEGESHGRSINDFNRVVGEASGGPFLWSKGFAVQRLSSFLISNPPAPNVYFITANGINNAGQIVGYYHTDTDSGRAYLLTPVIQPPLSLLLFP